MRRPAKILIYFVVLARIPKASQKQRAAKNHSTVTDLAKFRG